MAYNKFMTELGSLRAHFMFSVKGIFEKTYKHTFYMDICDGYILISVEGEDKEHKRFLATARITHLDYEQTCYQRSLRISKVELEAL